MSQVIFDMIVLLENRLLSEHLNIHQIKQMLIDIVKVSKNNPKLRIITQFLSVLNAVVDVYEYDDAESISDIKSLVLDGLSFINQMVNETISNKEGIQKINDYTTKCFYFLNKKFPNNQIISNSILWEQLSVEIEQDINVVKNLIAKFANKDKLHENFAGVQYYLKRLAQFTHLLNIQPLFDLINRTLMFISSEYESGRAQNIVNNKQVQRTFDQLIHLSVDMKNSLNNHAKIFEYLENFEKNTIPSMIFESITPKIESSENFLNSTHSLLSTEEINALITDDDDQDIVNFDVISSDDVDVLPVDVPIDKSTDPVRYILNSDKEKISNTSSYNMHLEDEDKLLELTGKLFLKQEQIKTALHQQNYMGEELHEIENLTNDIKKVLFDHYYVKMGDFLGADLRLFIKHEARLLNKKIRLGIKGEESEILSREKDFVKKIVFDLVRYSIHHSIENESRRRALDKSEAGWLLIEFDDSGDKLSIYIRDDGRGLTSHESVLQKIQDEIIQKNGLIEINSEENEYLKIRIELPMKKIITKSLVIQVGDTKILLPTRCISQALTPNEAAMILKTDHCLGQIALTSLIGMKRTPINAYLLCHFGGEKILLGVEQILYKIEALMEEVHVPLIPCASSVVVLKDGSIGFLMNEREIYSVSKKLIAKRTEMLLENTII